jgi:hypothetical protein
MRVDRFAHKLVNKLALGALMLGASLVTGCKSYHYYDVDVKFASGFTLADAGMIQFCTLIVSGADSGSFTFPDNNSSPPICPIVSNYPDLGTFEYSTFEESGTLHFVVSAYTVESTPPDSSTCFAVGNTDVSATSEITTPVNMTLSKSTSGCVQ